MFGAPIRPDGAQAQTDWRDLSSLDLIEES
jgi:hypothetical protein